MAEEKQEKKGFWKEFREFIARGNILAMAVGLLIGGAFTQESAALPEGEAAAPAPEKKE